MESSSSSILKKIKNLRNWSISNLRTYKLHKYVYFASGYNVSTSLDETRNVIALPICECNFIWNDFFTQPFAYILNFRSTTKQITCWVCYWLFTYVCGVGKVHRKRGFSSPSMNFTDPKNFCLQSLTNLISNIIQCYHTLWFVCITLQKWCLPDTGWFSKKTPVTNRHTTPICEKYINLRWGILISANRVL